MRWVCYIVGMNIYCEWNNDILLVKCGKNTIASVMLVSDEPCLTFMEGANASLTFGEIEYIMDNWSNMPKS